MSFWDKIFNMYGRRDWGSDNEHKNPDREEFFKAGTGKVIRAGPDIERLDSRVSVGEANKEVIGFLVGKGIHLDILQIFQASDQEGGRTLTPKDVSGKTYQGVVGSKHTITYHGQKVTFYDVEYGNLGEGLTLVARRSNLEYNPGDEVKVTFKRLA